MALAAIILTYNEEKHIRRCIESLSDCVDKIYIMDSFSTDATIKIVSEYSNVEVSQNDFINHASQFNHALNFFDINEDWLIRVDADEYIDADLSNYLVNELPNLPANICGVNLNRYIKFMGRLLQRGGMSDYWILRVWRNGSGKCEQRWMDEHIVLSHGDITNACGMLVDDNLNTLSWWAHKHVDYSTREAIDILQVEYLSEVSDKNSSLFGRNTARKRFLKSIYNKAPLFTRPFIYFIYRYIFRLGFLDGKQGFLWNVLQGFWYRLMVDAKVYEIKSELSDGKDLKEVIKRKYNYEI